MMVILKVVVIVNNTAMMNVVNSAVLHQEVVIAIMTVIRLDVPGMSCSAHKYVCMCVSR